MPAFLAAIGRAIASGAKKAASTVAARATQAFENSTIRKATQKAYEKYKEWRLDRAEKTIKKETDRMRDEISKTADEFQRQGSSPPRMHGDLTEGYNQLNDQAVKEIYNNLGEYKQERYHIWKESTKNMGLPDSVVNAIQGLSDSQFFGLVKLLDLDERLRLAYIEGKSIKADQKMQDFEQSMEVKGILSLIQNYRSMYASGAGL